MFCDHCRSIPGSSAAQYEASIRKLYTVSTVQVSVKEYEALESGLVLRSTLRFLIYLSITLYYCDYMLCYIYYLCMFTNTKILFMI